MKSIKFLASIALLFSATLQAEIITQEISYSSNDTVLNGYLAYDDSVTEKRPGVLVVHEWWGHDDYARKRAQMLAELGYTALALDMYGDGKQASHPEDAKKFMTAALENKDQATARFMAAMKLLQEQETVDANKISAIGYCFGGGVVLNMARQGLDLDSVVSFHGSLSAYKPTEKDAVKAKVLVLNGADDPFVSLESQDNFIQEMDAAGADYEFVSYAGAMHSFTNPAATLRGEEFELPLAYNEAADKQSWQAMQDLFNSIYQ